MAKKVKKKDSTANMLEYTYRDSGQEFIMKRKMVRAIFIAILTIIALVVFIALYIAETHRVQETYRAQYSKAMESVVDDMLNYENADGDFDLRYRMILADMSAANSFIFLLDDMVDKQKTINGIYTVILKYPEQVKERMPELRAIMQNITANLDSGYDEIDAFIETINLKGY